MSGYLGIEQKFAGARPPRAGSTSWYDACDDLATVVKARLRKRFERGFLVEVYGDDVGLLLRVRGDGYGARPWSVDRSLVLGESLEAQIDSALRAVEACVKENYVGEPAPAQPTQLWPQ